MSEHARKDTTFCILVTSSPESENSRTLVKISEAAMQLGHHVQIFLMCDGVYHLHSQDLSPLISKGAEVILCAHNALERGLERKSEVLFGSQYDLAVMVARSDGFLALT